MSQLPECSNPQYITSSNDNDVNIQSDRFMALNRTVSSYNAISFINALTELIATVMDTRPLAKLNRAIGAITADLMANAKDCLGAWSYRPVGSGDFTHLTIGYRPLITAREGLLRLKLIDFRPGIYMRRGGETSKIRGNKALFDLAAGFGIDPSNYPQHFKELPRPSIIAKPIILRAERRSFAGEERGRKLPVHWHHPKVIEAKKVVDAINAYFATVRIDGAEHYGFKRIFGAGNDPKFDWDMGGRIYSVGGGYQAMPAKERRNILLNGAAIIELDIKASHLTIIRALLQAGRRNSDPYDVEGVPRSVVKSWVTMCLGYGDFHQRWSPPAIARYAKDFKGRDLETDYPLAEVRELLKLHLPEIVQALDQGLGWARLQYVESCAIIEAVYELATVHDVPALPVHDSLIVPARAEALAAQVLGRTFSKYVGVMPGLDTKKAA